MHAADLQNLLIQVEALYDHASDTADWAKDDERRGFNRGRALAYASVAEHLRAIIALA
jgi:hypothetical protein